MADQIQNQMGTDTEVLSPKQAAQLLDITINTLYNWVNQRKIAFYKFGGKKLYFKRSELLHTIFNDRHASNDELEAQAATELMKRGRK